MGGGYHSSWYASGLLLMLSSQSFPTINFIFLIAYSYASTTLDKIELVLLSRPEFNFHLTVMVNHGVIACLLKHAACYNFYLSTYQDRVLRMGNYGTSAENWGHLLWRVWNIEKYPDLRIVSSINGTFSDMHYLQHMPLCQVLFFLGLFFYFILFFFLLGAWGGGRMDFCALLRLITELIYLGSK